VNDSGYLFPLGIQTLLPDRYRDVFRERLGILQRYGFSGIELNIPEPDQIDPKDLSEYLAGFGLRMTMFASGATAKAEARSLSDDDQKARLASVRRCMELVDFAAEFGAGIIIGYMKGGPTPNRERATHQFADSLSRLDPYVREREVPLLVEATNHYESTVANSLQEAADLVGGFGHPYLQILPDTYHMNIEETSMLGALVKHADLYRALHISDNNRYFPGLGAIDFLALLRFLEGSGYQGSLAIEGSIRESFEMDLHVSMSLLRPMLQQIARETN
jgi:sugar phosphate isomerase/epimerase